MMYSAPLLTQAECESGTDVFDICVKNKNSGVKSGFFGKESATLSVSGQLHLECACTGVLKAYAINSCFRPEKHHTKQHLAEFSMAEAEIAFLDSLELLIEEVKQIIKKGLLNLLGNSCEWLSENEKDRIQNVFLQSDWPVITYKEACEIINSNIKTHKLPFIGDMEEMRKSHESFLFNTHFSSPFFIVRPIFEHKSFYMKSSQRLDKQRSTLAESFDLFFPVCGEVAGGSLREDDLNLLQSNINSKMGKEAAQSLGWYLDLRKYGHAKSGGFGIGIERLLQSMLQIEHIKDTIPFPRIEGKIRF